MSDPLRAELLAAVAHKEDLRRKIEKLEASLFSKPARTSLPRIQASPGNMSRSLSPSPEGYDAHLRPDRAGARSVSPRVLSKHRKAIESRNPMASRSPSPKGTMTESLSPESRSASAMRLRNGSVPVLSKPSLNPAYKKHSQVHPHSILVVVHQRQSPSR